MSKGWWEYFICPCHLNVHVLQSTWCVGQCAASILPGCDLPASLIFYNCLSHSSCVEVTQQWGLGHVKRTAIVLSSIHAISCLAEHMVCWTSVQHPYRLYACWNGSARLIVPVLCIFMCVIFVSYSVAWGCAMLSHILIRVMLLLVLHMRSLRLSPQCHAFI